MAGRLNTAAFRLGRLTLGMPVKGLPVIVTVTARFATQNWSHPCALRPRAFATLDVGRSPTAC